MPFFLQYVYARNTWNRRPLKVEEGVLAGHELSSTVKCEDDAAEVHTHTHTRTHAYTRTHTHTFHYTHDTGADLFCLSQGRLLVGHGLRNDLKAMMLDHPRKDIRDTARCVYVCVYVCVRVCVCVCVCVCLVRAHTLVSCTVKGPPRAAKAFCQKPLVLLREIVL
jgi:hypothetical protein